MRYKDFGKTGEKVSVLCLGTWALGGKQFGAVPEADAISAHPNPTSSMVYIESDGNADVEVYSIEGRSEGRYENANAIDLSDKPAGIYLLKVSTETNSAVIRIVKR